MVNDEDVRVFMREHFLRTLNSFNEAAFTMHENMKLTGQFGCSNSDLKYFHVTNLKTPIGICKDSLLRSSDIISIEFKVPPSLALNFSLESY